MLYRMEFESPLGQLILVEEAGELRGVWFQGQAYEQAGIAAEIVIDQETALLKQVAQALQAYFAGQVDAFAGIPLAPQGTAFQQEVWNLLGTIPYGEKRTYGQLAQLLGVRSAQAVGGAVGRNPISLLVPCHRVVGAKGQLTGYAAGLERKSWLLEFEKRNKR